MTDTVDGRAFEMVIKGKERQKQTMLKASESSTWHHSSFILLHITSRARIRLKATALCGSLDVESPV